MSHQEKEWLVISPCQCLYLYSLFIYCCAYDSCDQLQLLMIIRYSRLQCVQVSRRLPPLQPALLLTDDDRVENRQNKLQGLIICCQKIFGALDIIYCKCMPDYKLAGVNS